MNAVKSVPIVTPDGVERNLRFTLGARKRITEIFGLPDIKDVLNKYGDGAIPELLYSCLHDEDGNPPKDLTANRLAETLAPEDAAEMLAAFMCAVSQGRVSKNDLEALVEEALKKAEPIGLKPLPSEASVSDSPQEKSGGDTSNVSSMPSPSSGENGKTSKTTAPEPSQQA